MGTSTKIKSVEGQVDTCLLQLVRDSGSHRQHRQLKQNQRGTLKKRKQELKRLEERTLIILEEFVARKHEILLQSPRSKEELNERLASIHETIAFLEKEAKYFGTYHTEGALLQQNQKPQLCLIQRDNVEDCPNHLRDNE